MILAAVRDIVGAVELFGEDEAGELVGEDQAGKAPDKVGFLADGLVDTEGAADDEDDFASVYKGGFEGFAELRGGEVVAALVEENDVLVWLEGPRCEIFFEFVFGVESPGEVKGFS